MNAPLAADTLQPVSPAPVDYRTEPSKYHHWSLKFEGAVATLAMGVDENAGLRPGYKLKLNSYDLGVDVELHDAINRIRFEHPEVRTVVVTSSRERVFCSGANIFMLGVSSHGWKVNFCKFTNETRNGFEDSSSQNSGLKFLAAVNGSCAGGGYELALACDEILLVDDRSSAVSLPEVPLLGVLPGTGGLTRVTDKRHVRHDLADIFCTTTEGVRGQKAKDWRLVDDIVKPAAFAAKVQERAQALAAQSDRPALGEGIKGVALTRIERQQDANSVRYEHVSVEIDRARRQAVFTVKAPTGAQPSTVDGIVAAGAAWYPLAMARQLDDAILHMRTNELDIGTWIWKTSGDSAAVQAMDAVLLANQGHWLVRETIGLLRRTLSRIDVSSRSLFALIEEGSCFTGTFLEFALACDRSYQLALPDDAAKAPKIMLTEANFGPEPAPGRSQAGSSPSGGGVAPGAAPGGPLYPMATGQSRIARRFYEEAGPLAAARATIGQALDADAALALGLVTSAPDDIDWADEVRIALEERAAMSPDALTGMEANLRFNGPENMFTRIFGRLTAWQNWIFQRPNAVGDKGALKLYGKGEKAQFDMNRV